MLNCVRLLSALHPAPNVLYSCLPFPPGSYQSAGHARDGSGSGPMAGLLEMRDDCDGFLMAAMQTCLLFPYHVRSVRRMH